jgi:hypothetical protein
MGKNKLPENPKKGDEHTITVDNPKGGKRKVTFRATGKKGFGKWKIVKNVKA